MDKTTNILEIHFPRWDELPDFDIYVDQVVNIIESKLKLLQFKEDEKIITKSMINNYVKHGIVAPPIKKRYSKVHVAYLFVVCILKRVYSLEEIGKMLLLQTTHYPIDVSYNYFLEEFEHCLTSIIKKESIHHIEPIHKNAKTIILCQEIILSVAYKISVESAITLLEIEENF